MKDGAGDAAGSPSKVDKGALLPSSIADDWTERFTKFYLIPEGPFLANWDRFMVLVSVISSFMVSFMIAFKHFTGAAWAVSYAIDFCFLLDMYIKFHIAYLQGGFWVVFPKEMATYYLSTREFKFDVLISVPFDLIALGWVADSESALYVLALCRIPKIIRSARIIIFFQRQERKLHATFFLQIVKFMSYLFTLTHSLSCIWFSIACPKGDAVSCNNPSWAYGQKVVAEDGSDFLTSLSSRYTESLYWTVTTMTTTGYGDITPHNDGERVFAICTMLCGVFFYGYVSGTIASALANMDSRRVSYQQKMDAVRQYMSDRMMDFDMQERVLDYYDYVWERNKGIDIKNLFEDMPSTFRSEVALSLNNAIIEKANIFRGCSVGFRRMIAIDMKLYLFTANEYVVHRGDLGLEMYFITQGRIDVYSTEDLKRPTASLIEGAHFGEFQIILGHRHEYSARAVCNTDIYVLHKEDLERAFEAYPEDRQMVEAATNDRYKQAMSTKKSRVRPTSIGDIEDEFGVANEKPISGVPATAATVTGGSKRRSSLAQFMSLSNSHPISSSSLKSLDGPSDVHLKDKSSSGSRSLKKLNETAVTTSNNNTGSGEKEETTSAVGQLGSPREVRISVHNGQANRISREFHNAGTASGTIRRTSNPSSSLPPVDEPTNSTDIE